VKERISSEYREQVTFQPEKDLFVSCVPPISPSHSQPWSWFASLTHPSNSVISLAITVLLRNLESACEGPLTAMIRMSWSTLERVTGPSGYVVDLAKAVDTVVEAVRDGVEQKRYLRNFYDKVARYVFACFRSLIFRKLTGTAGWSAVWWLHALHIVSFGVGR
jgi:vacuolar protein sorting-associated protein 53